MDVTCTFMKASLMLDDKHILWCNIEREAHVSETKPNHTPHIFRLALCVHHEHFSPECCSQITDWGLKKKRDYITFSVSSPARAPHALQNTLNVKVFAFKALNSLTSAYVVNMLISKWAGRVTPMLSSRHDSEMTSK